MAQVVNGMRITRNLSGTYWVHRGESFTHGPFNTFEAAVNATSLLRRIYG